MQVTLSPDSHKSHKILAACCTAIVILEVVEAVPHEAGWPLIRNVGLAMTGFLDYQRGLYEGAKAPAHVHAGHVNAKMSLRLCDPLLLSTQSSIF